MGKIRNSIKEITQTYSEKYVFLYESYVAGQMPYRKKPLKRLL